MLKQFNMVVMTALVLLSGCSDGVDTKQAERKGRMITFSGYEWKVYSSGDSKSGPGPNFFSDSENNIWVDDAGQLHLKISSSDGKWLCAKVELVKSFGYNKYTFYIDTDPQSLDRNVVWGFYTYNSDTEEIDIEFSRWGMDENKESQYAVQPSGKTGNKTRFSLNSGSVFSTHSFEWKSDKIYFTSLYGHKKQTNNPDNIINMWTYEGEDIPPDNNEKLKINLWLFRGAAPANNSGQEVVISGFEIQ